MRHKIFPISQISPNSNIPSPVCNILRHGKTATCPFEGGGMAAGKRRGVEVTGRDLRLQRSARGTLTHVTLQSKFQMSFDGTGCFHWCVGRSAEECTLTRFSLNTLPCGQRVSRAQGSFKKTDELKAYWHRILIYWFSDLGHISVTGAFVMYRYIII